MKTRHGYPARTPETRPPGEISSPGAPWLLAAFAFFATVSTPAGSHPDLDLFTDEAEAVGIDFVHFNGMSGEKYYCEMVGSGAAMFDYDNDGDLDVYLVQGKMLGPGKTLADSVFPPRGPLPLKDRLYRNDLAGQENGARALRFTDVTEESGIAGTGYGMGVAAADVNNDGWVDLFVSNFGENQLFRNQGDGTFTEVPLPKASAPRWSVSAAFLDYDRDGWLDLYVGNYVNFSLSYTKGCFGSTGVVDYCGPLSYDPVPDRLLRNRGDGTFQEATAQAQVAREYNGALGVVTADFNQDGWIDLYVANDQRPNHLWINQKNGTFSNEAVLAGCAFNKDGKAESSMGVDTADFDNDGDEDLFMTHLRNETNTLYLNDGDGWFEDQSAKTRLAIPSLPFTGFGTAFLDYDNNGWLDVLSLNGHVSTLRALARANDPYPLHQPNQLFRNLGDGRFEDVTDRAGKVFELSEVSRGGAFGDIDNDGDTDVLVANNNGRARLMINQTGHGRHWLGLRLVSRELRRDVLGTRVGLFLPDGRVLWRRVRADGSFASANDSRLLFGLGAATGVVKVRAYWMGGGVEEWNDPAVDRYTTLYQGSGRAVTKP